MAVADLAPYLLLPDTVHISQTDEQGPLFVNASGFTLYTNEGDETHTSTCNNTRYHQVLGEGQNPTFMPDPDTRPTCEEAWPPLRPDSDSAPVGDWSVFSRHDGTLQWSYQGKPVYTSSYDSKPGDITGNRGFLTRREPLFAPANVPSGMSARLTRAGFILTRSDGLSLYARAEGAAPCRPDCGSQWQPFYAPAVIRLDDNDTHWSAQTLPDGSRQWAFDGKLLYSYHRDRTPGDLHGGGEAEWTPVVLSPPLAPPDDIKVQMSGDGEVFADRQGMTLYVWYCNDESPDRLPCDHPEAPSIYRDSICGTGEACINTWRPVVASPGSKQVGQTWTIIPVDPTGRRQFAPDDAEIQPLMVWAYQGRPVYTYAGDREPGDIWGHSIRARRLWGYWMITPDISGYINYRN